MRHPDPELSSSRHRYAAGLYDAHSPEVLYGEVLSIPEWTQPTASAEAIRLNGGVPPPPEPVLPTEFTIQLYNPDQQIVVKQTHAKWGSTPSWDFEVPQQTFRQPSSSALDRTQNDPAGSDITPKIGFRWKKDSKLSKDLACFQSGKAMNPDGTKKKNKEPDITVSIFKGLKELTLYEPNLKRVELEDMKGFEVVLLLGAVVIRDIYFGHMKDTFNISEAPLSPASSAALLAGTNTSSNGHQIRPAVPGAPARDPRVPPTDARSQWEIDAETARLKRVAAEEERQRKRRDEEEQREIKKMLEQEEKDARRQQAAIDAETERLKRMYMQEDSQARPSLPPRHNGPHSDPRISNPYNRPHTASSFYPTPWAGSAPGPAPGPYGNSPYLNAPGGQPSHSTFFGSDSGQYNRVKPKKSSWFGSRRDLGENDNRLQKKRSSIW